MTNALEDQYIMYCGATATVVTLSYRNVITDGSTAFPPSTTSLITTITSTMSSESLTSATLSSPVASQSTSASSLTSALSKGAIAGISVGSFFFIALLITLVFLFCIRPKLARNRQIKYAGGFSSNNNDKGTPSTLTLTLTSLNDLIHGRRRKRWEGGREGAASGGRVGGLGISEADYSSVPWSPTSITAYSPSELPDEPLPSPSPRTIHAAAQGSPTVRHVMEQASSPAAQAALNPHSPAYPSVPVSGVTPHDSMLVSELSTLMTDSNTPHTSTQMTTSSLNVSRPPSDNTYRRLSARGGGRGYVSPEMALANGWRDGGDEGGEADNGEGDGGPAELEGDENGNGNGNGKRGS